MNSILIIEDDTALANGLTRALSSDSITVQSCGSLSLARQKLKEESYSLLLLDVNLPDGNGFDFLKEIKQSYPLPVIMLTANDLEMDIVNGLEQGADDYITKPFSLAILRARVHTQLNRVNTPLNRGNTQVSEDNTYVNLSQTTCLSTSHSDSRFVIDDYQFDFDKMKFYYKETAVELSKTEQKLLRVFIENRGVTLSRATLIDYIWTDDAAFVEENALSVTIKRLRDKLCAQEYIKTIYGIGYVWLKELPAS